MPDSPTHSSICNTHDHLHLHKNNSPLTISVELVSDEEMSLTRTAFSLALAAARRPSFLLSSSALSSSPFSLQSNSLVSNRGSSSSVVCDVEDLGQIKSPQKKKTKLSDSLLTRYRAKRGLSVTDLTSTEWCEKQMEFVLRFGRPEMTSAMKAGIARHAKLEEEVSKKVELRVEALEDKWALKFINFLICANQLLFDEITREMPVFGFVQGVWIVGVIDELRMPASGNDRKLTLIDTKTRAEPRLPADPQRRKGRLQLMYYKCLWDKLVSADFPSEQFYEFFSMDPEHMLSDEVKMNAADSGFPAKSLGELETYFRKVCSMLQPAQDQLLLRYELQEDNSLIYEDEFSYDDDWLKAQINSSLEFWREEREPNFVSEIENWKCRYCKFASVCPQTQTQTQTQTQSEASSQPRIHN